MSWTVTMQDPYPPRSTNERILAEEPVDVTSRLYDDSHQNVYKRVQPRSGFSIMTSSIRDKSFAESYENGTSPLTHVAQYTHDMHKKRTSGVTVWEYDMGESESTENPPKPNLDPTTSKSPQAQAASTEDAMPSAELLNEYAKKAFAALEEQSVEPTFEHLYTELKKQKLSENVISYILDNMMMHNLMRSLKEQSIAVTEESIQSEMKAKEINPVVRERVMRRYAAWTQAK